MKNIFYKILVISITTFVTTSCLKDLDQLPQDDRTTAESLFQQDPFGTYQSLNAKLYAQLSLAGQGGPNGEGGSASDLSGFDNAGFFNYFRLWWNMQELQTDEAKNSWEGDAGMIEMSRNDISSSNEVVKGFYYRIYTNIAKINEFLREATDEKINSRNLTEVQKTEVKYFRAEARFLRALHYFHAMDNFGHATFIDETDLPSSNAPRVYTRQQLFNYIESELKAIENDLRNPRAVYGRADKSAAWMLLAKIYLNAGVYTGKKAYDKCLPYLEKIISSGYTIDKFRYSFLGDNHLSNEIIFPIVSDPNTSRSYGNVSYLINAAGESSQPVFYLGSGGQWGGNKTTKEFINLFDKNDGRAMFDKREEFSEFINDLSVDKQGYRITKFTNIRRDGTYIVGGNTQGCADCFVDTDFPIFRLADAYLMYAECALNGSGSKDQAVIYINKLRDRSDVHADNITVTDLTTKFLIDERGRELYWEGHRRQDLIRFGLFGGNNSANYTWNWKKTATGTALPDYYNLYPIPYQQVVLNPNLTQNPGY